MPAMRDQCPYDLWRLYRWYRVREKVPRLTKLSTACETPRRKRARTARAKNRRKFIKKGLVRPGQRSVHIHHKNGNTKDNRSANLHVMRASAHRRLHARKRVR